jgi:hypothetical protein
MSRGKKWTREMNEAVIAESDAPWEMQPFETSKSFSAFKHYRDMTPVTRTIANGVTEFYGVVRGTREHNAKMSLWANWSQLNRWQDRVMAWTIELDRLDRESKMAAIREMNERHSRIAQTMIGLAAQRLRGLNPDELSAGELRRWFMEAARLERGTQGEPESIVEWKTDVTKLTDEELKAIIDS